MAWRGDAGRGEFNWMAGGPQGSGVDTAATIFSRACGYGGLHLYGKREYHSNIKGLHSYFHIRVSPREVLANVNDVDLLAAFDHETVARHFDEVSPGGGLILDAEGIEKSVFDMPTLPKEFKEELEARLKDRGIGGTVQDLIEEVERRGGKIFPVSYMELLRKVSESLGLGLTRVMPMLNVLTIGISFSLLRYDISLVEKAVMSTFSSRPKIAEMNILALREAYKYAEKTFPGGLGFSLEKVSTIEERIVLQGHQAIALGKILGGCRMQIYYPITPAGDESWFLESHEVFKTIDGEGSILVVQAEDELAAINIANGAALAGARAATSTSGPGFSLMVEGLGWAGNNEVPVVITYYQRGAPSTGLPTRHGQDDLRFAIHAGHGEFARVVLASGDIKECFYDAAKAFNYAERYQLPVIHLVDKALADSYKTYTLFGVEEYRIDRGKVLDRVDPGEEYRRFRITENGISPRAFLGSRGRVHWYTGDEHNEYGHITEHSSMRTSMVEKRMRKIELIEKEVPLEEKLNFFGDEDSDTIILSWGSPKGAILEALERLRGRGYKIGFLQVRMVHPLPASYVYQTLRDKDTIIDVEMNYSGQLGGIIREKTGIPMSFYVLKYNGRPMTATEVYEALERILMGGAPERQVLTYGP
ncbi:MAG: 2-oxoacid:ferredoxin oxidoreductase subunit alpha [Candidatus Bathyarchaeia archaeon]